MKSKSLILIFAFCLCSLVSTFADEAKQETFSAVVTNIPGRISTLSMKIIIKSYTPDEELVQLANFLKTQGPDALLKAINKMERGRMAPADRLGSDVGLVRSRPTEKGRLITMVMDRPMSFAELWRDGRSTDYPFGLLQMEIDKDGKGQGQLLVATKIKFTDENSIEIENYGTQPLKLISITKLK